MCGLVGVVSDNDIGVCLYDTLTVLQHRGQDAAGIMTCDNGKLNLRKDNGLVKDVFRTRHMRIQPLALLAQHSRSHSMLTVPTA
jgi:amidophosphoribosyltransferase